MRTVKMRELKRLKFQRKSIMQSQYCVTPTRQIYFHTDKRPQKRFLLEGFQVVFTPKIEIICSRLIAFWKLVHSVIHRSLTRRSPILTFSWLVLLLIFWISEDKLTTTHYNICYCLPALNASRFSQNKRRKTFHIFSFRYLCCLWYKKIRKTERKTL